MARALKRGSPYAFDILASRAFGKLRESSEVIMHYSNVSDADLASRIAELERDLGLTDAGHEVLPESTALALPAALALPEAPKPALEGTEQAAPDSEPVQ
jgi:hypothetical protein